MKYRYIKPIFLPNSEGVNKNFSVIYLSSQRNQNSVIPNLQAVDNNGKP